MDECRDVVLGDPAGKSALDAEAIHFIEMMRDAGECTDLELLAEVYHILRSSVRMSHDEMRTVFADWNKTELAGAFLAATADVLGVMDEDGVALVEKVLDKPRGRPSGAEALERILGLGQPCGILASAVFSHSLAAMKDERVGASAILGGPKAASTGERHAMVEDLRKALLAARILAYAEIFSALEKARAARGWQFDSTLASSVWHGNGSPSSEFSECVEEAFKREPRLVSILLDSRIKSLLDQSLPSLRKVCSKAVELGTPVPSLAAAIAYYDAYRSTWLPANLILAVRDHSSGGGYERVDRPRGESFFSDWK